VEYVRHAGGQEISAKGKAETLKPES